MSICQKRKFANIPQRQRIAGNGAVVAKGKKGNAVQEACRMGAAEKDIPQRQRIAECAAVAVDEVVESKTR